MRLMTATLLFAIASAIGQLFAITSVLVPGVDKESRLPAPPWVEIKADAILTVLTAVEKSRWLLIDDGADLVPSGDGRTATFGALAKGRYRVVVVSPNGDAARIVVVVGDVVPADPLTAKLQTAYRLDMRDAAKKQQDLAELVELYKQASDFAVKPDVASLAGLILLVREAARTLIIEGLTEVRKAVADELKFAFPVDAAFDDASRAKAKALFLKISACLKEVK